MKPELTIMFKFVIISALVAVAYGGRVDELGWRIVGGSEAAVGQFPHIISLRRTSHSCGGSIINDRWILTAAHCVVNVSPSAFTVVTGSNKLNSGGDQYKVEKVISHANYNPSLISNDIAVLKLTTSIQFNANVQPIPLSSEVTGAGEDAILSGWGTTTYPGSTPNNLQWIVFQSISVAECQSKQSPNPVYDTQICTFTKRGEGACHGDSGGPLQNAAGEQIGIVSWGRPCAVGYPDVFTRVSSFIGWIEQNINTY